VLQDEYGLFDHQPKFLVVKSVKVASFAFEPPPIPDALPRRENVKKIREVAMKANFQFGHQTVTASALAVDTTTVLASARR
jgi:hypothetical protein